MNLQDYKNLKNSFNHLFFVNNVEEIMSYKEDLNKILNAFNFAKTQEISALSKDELLKLKNEAQLNLDIEKLKQINKELDRKSFDEE